MDKVRNYGLEINRWYRYNYKDRKDIQVGLLLYFSKKVNMFVVFFFNYISYGIINSLKSKKL